MLMVTSSQQTTIGVLPSALWWANCSKWYYFHDLKTIWFLIPCSLALKQNLVVVVQARSTLSVNTLEFWHARGPSGLARLAKDLICASPSKACVERIFLVYGLLWTTTLYVQVSRDESLSKSQPDKVLKETSRHLVLMLMLMTYIYRNSLAKQNRYGDWQLFDGELKLKCFVN